MSLDLDSVRPHDGMWTTDDLDELPESHRRYELIDGTLLVPASPTAMHQTTMVHLAVALDEGCPAECDVTHAMEVRISKTCSLVPDVLAVTVLAAQLDPSKFEPHEVVMVAEIVESTSVSWDRIMRPAVYAQAGIPIYWRVETEPAFVVHTYRLEAGSYRQTGEFDERVTIDEPWEIDFPVSQLLPRYLRRPQ